MPYADLSTSKWIDNSSTYILSGIICQGWIWYFAEIVGDHLNNNVTKQAIILIWKEGLMYLDSYFM